MSINETAYDTTACSGYRYSKIISNLDKGSLMGALRGVEAKLDPHAPSIYVQLLEGGNASADSIQFFKHPVFISRSTGQAGDAALKQVCLDVREYGRWVAPQQQFIVRNGPEYTWAIKRALLNVVWAEGRYEALRDISTIPAATYAALISECLARRFALDPAEQMSVAVLATYFYYALFTDNDFNEDEINRVAGCIARVTNVPAEKVFTILKGVPTLHNLEALCDAIKTKVGNIALDSLNVGTLLADTSGNWFGNNAREVLGIGLEHIPTWLMIVSASLQSATYKRSTMAKLSARFDKRGAGENFHKSLDVLLGGKTALIGSSEYSTYF